LFRSSLKELDSIEFLHNRDFEGELASYNDAKAKAAAAAAATAAAKK
jgi:uncharacterized protein YccT (UPF0319 family)